MMKPNFDQMSRAELKAYVLTHRDDEEAFRALRDKPVTRSGPYPALLDEESIRIGEEAMHQKIQEIENRRPPAANGGTTLL